jgi:acyl dehydratase
MADECLDEFMEESCKLIGKEDQQVIHANEEIDFYAIDNFARGIGDFNPIYSDPTYALTSYYAQRTRYGCLIAHPTMLAAIRHPASEGAFSKKDYGLANFFTAGEMEWYDVIRIGDQINGELKLIDVYEKTGWKGRRTAVLVSEAIYRNRYGAIIGKAKSTMTFIPFKRGKEMFYEREIHKYSKEEIDRLVNDLDNEVVRGSKPLYWDEIEVGDTLTPVVKGPYDMNDQIIWETAVSPYVMTTNVRHQHVLKNPGLMRKHPVTNWPHFDSDLEPEDIQSCKLRGMPLPFDRGILRVCLAGNLVTNWMSDEGFLKKLSIETPGPFLYGDATWFKGKVSDKYKEKVQGTMYRAIDLSIEGINQLGELTTKGSATVYLSGRGWPVTLPIPGGF